MKVLRVKHRISVHPYVLNICLVLLEKLIKATCT